ncbi:MAG: serine/threonine-protein kinase [Pirellulaceae bacterium]
MNEPPKPSASREQKLDELIAQYMQRTDAGEEIDVDAFLASHGDLADSFRGYLRDLSAIDNLPRSDPEGKASQSQDTNASVAVDETIAQRPSRPEYEQAEALPRDFGRYRLLRELGRGAMGTVFLAEDSELHRQVALKQPQFSKSSDPSALERFYREARATATLNHPNICPVFDIGEQEGTPYITMAYVQGRTLADLLREQAVIENDVAAKITLQVASALAEAHEHGIIHRDIKPGNIIIDHRGQPIVTDFGLARQFEANDQSQLTQEGALVGTPAYMSPEQVDSDTQAVGPRSDIFSLGVVLYEMLCGRPPFMGNVLQVVTRISRDNAPPPSSFGRVVDADLETICMRMLHRNVADRYASMHEVADALNSYPQAKSAVSSSRRDAPRRGTLPERLTSPITLAIGSLLIFGIVAGILIKIKTNHGTAKVHVTDKALRNGPVEITIDAVDDAAKTSPTDNRSSMVITSSDISEEWELIFSEPEPLYGLKQWAPVTVNTSRPEFRLRDIEKTPEQLAIRRLWFKAADMYPTGKGFQSRDCNAWVISPAFKTISVEAAASEETSESIRRVQPSERLPDGAYCLIEIDSEKTLRPKRYATFVVHGISKPTISDCQVTTAEGRATVEAWLNNEGDGTLNDTRLKLILSRESEGRFVFVRRMNLNGFDVPPRDKKQMQLTFDVSKEMGGRYRLTVGMNPMHEDDDANRVAEAKSNVFTIP